MAKILLVEDDNNLREIYEARLQAEGYTIVSAQDGEDALVKAKQEHPDLVISDVMMPRISGFEMLDILRNTEGMKDMKVIMLTALGQAEDKTRADSLGADRYLVKSQVTLEDIVKAADELLNPAAPTTPQTAAAAAETATAPVAPVPTQTTNEPAGKPAESIASATPAPTPPTPTPSIPVVAAPAAVPTTQAPSVTSAVPATPPEPPQSPAPTPVPEPPAAAQTPTASAASTTSAATPPAIPAPEPTPQQIKTEKPVTQPTPDTTLANDKLIAEAVRDLTAAAEVANNPSKSATSTATTGATTGEVKSAPEKTQEPGATPAATPKDSSAAPTAPELPPASEPAVENTPKAQEPEPPKPEVTPSPTPSVVPSASDTAQAPEVSQAPSTVHEEAAMQAQIEDFIKQQGATVATPTEPTSEQNTAPEPASSQLPQASPTPEIIKQSTAPTFNPPTTAPADEQEESTDDTASDSVTVAHKKIIEPPTEPVNPRPDLSELLAKEGISDIDGDADIHANVVTPGGTTPHPPGHVITPTAAETAPPADTAFKPDDPNNIAL